MIQKLLVAMAFTGLITTGSFVTTSEASALSASLLSPSLKVPSKLTARMPIAKEIKDFLDRDFRSRYPVAAPLKVDVVQADVQMYTLFQVPNGFGGFDQRHSFRIVAQHADRTLVTIDVNIYERAEFEPDQDPILLETFRVVGWVR
ncbi:MAG: hypothetical protein U1E10_15465 [Bdellovibrionales bacterium]|nr:hypothetical protein [Bdellovibrionales bacterium]